MLYFVRNFQLLSRNFFPFLQIISLVTKAVTAITQRLTSLSSFDGVESKVQTLVATAKSHDNLCRMAPEYHPWL